MKNLYKVAVANIGTIIETESYDEAKSTYDAYVLQSEAEYGRASGEDIVLWEACEPLEVHYGNYNAD